MIENFRVNLIDVGASGGVQTKWQLLKNLYFYGFEPDKRDDANVGESSSKETWFPIGVARENGTYPFHLTRVQCNSSMLAPNTDQIKHLAYNLADFDIINTLNVECTNLDSIIKKHGFSPDAVKLDTQGSELDILKGSSELLQKHIFSLEVEVEFLELYKGQDLFHQVDAYMRANHFALMDIGNKLYMKGKYSLGFNSRKGFLVSGDALYFKDISYLIKNAEAISIQKWQAILAICKTYGYLNYAYELFSRLKIEKPETCKKLFIQFDPLEAIKRDQPKKTFFKISERKYASIRSFFEKRIKPKNSCWDYGLGNSN